MTTLNPEFLNALLADLEAGSISEAGKAAYQQASLLNDDGEFDGEDEMFKFEHLAEKLGVDISF